MLKIKIKLKEVLKTQGVTQKQLESMTGVPQSRISTLCSGERQEVNLLILEKIADALEITDISVLLQFEEESDNE
ncbi:helix-turn-helix domain-containing protein [Paenibacillus odorifer]|uniref:helix-turn-helix domain-containing protein n=1 Tax=Paenibacillus odorifer TaxID=189426 RepID=UPI00096E4B0D|nr:helix-turn-helix transcriptional regulator [Paenibacillus odorifer]OMD66089.1 transcriptional regulator [Paenibacillus odorifer]